jgi:maltooligosyltrehalose trehalohydrolase
MPTSAATLTGEALLGANRTPDGEWEFLLWAPNAKEVSVHLLGSNERIVAMSRDARGYHFARVEPMPEGTRYLYRLDGSRELPDPASRFQPDGIHGPSEVVDTSGFIWTDDGWTGVPLDSSVLYEVHVGTFTEEGTFESLLRHLDDLVALGVTTLEIMPVAQFPGGRNWGYDGVYPYAPQNTYGGPKGLQRLVNSAHVRGLAVALDVVYNHLGPEGNYLGAYGPYFTDRYRTPWGEAVNYDGGGSDEVRRFFLENALYWVDQYHFDVLRLDAVHGIFDFSATHFLAELKSATERLAGGLGRRIQLIAESDLNDSRIITGRERGGYDFDAQWSDDFHHSLHTLLAHEKKGYYKDFGEISHLAQTLRSGWYYSGQYSASRRRKHGNSSQGITPSHFVVCNQNHDQVGNRATGDRLSALIDFEGLKLAAGATLLSPFVPLLFMGEEYGETSPFQYFTSHLDANLVESVRLGRREEFEAFGWEGSVPDPQDPATFCRSQLQHSLMGQEPHATLLRFYKELIRLRNELKLGKTGSWRVEECGTSALWLIRECSAHTLAMMFNFSSSAGSSEAPRKAGAWKVKLSSADQIWRGPRVNSPDDLGSSQPFVVEAHPHSFILLKHIPSGLEQA